MSPPPIVGEQILELVDRMRGETLEDIPEVGDRVDTVEFAGGDQAVDRRRALPSVVASDEQVILSIMQNSA